jgi:hypothetical protein
MFTLDLNKAKFILKGVEGGVKKIVTLLAEKYFLAALFFLFLGLITAFFVFHRSVVLGVKPEPIISEKPLQFNEQGFSEVIDYYQQLQEREIEIREGRDPFQIKSPGLKPENFQRS